MLTEKQGFKYTPDISIGQMRNDLNEVITLRSHKYD
jgi:hypothetical protein